LLDLPAWFVALIYRYRWTIEVFFRFFEHVPACRHLLSCDPVAIEIQTYCAIIACMLISLWTGRKPTLRRYEMIPLGRQLHCRPGVAVQLPPQRRVKSGWVGH
jgi:hypothetical protein